MGKNILITGATGNVGEALLYALFEQKTSHNIIAGVRNIERGRQSFCELIELQYRSFDFEAPNTYSDALEGIDVLFLLRPPHIADVEKIFRPLVTIAKNKGVQSIVFLSVQGADKMSFIPHSKIERIIKESSIQYCFLRPSYFMQNLTTTLKEDVAAGCIVLPAGKALFNWIDVGDVGRVAAVVLNDVDRFKNQAFDLTGDKNLSFAQVVNIINTTLHTHLRYRSPSLFSFYLYKKQQMVVVPMIMVMIMLHFLPRLQSPPIISGSYEKLTGKKPISIEEFILKSKSLLFVRETI